MINNKLSILSILIRTFYLQHVLGYALFIMIGYSFNILYDIGFLLRELAIDYSSHIVWEYDRYLGEYKNRLIASASFINDIQMFHWNLFTELPILRFYHSARTLFIVMIVSINIILYLRVFIKDSPMHFIFSSFLINCMSFIIYFIFIIHFALDSYRVPEFESFIQLRSMVGFDMMVAFAFPILFIFSIIMGFMIILLFKHPSKIDKYIHTPIAVYIILFKDFFNVDILFSILFITINFLELAGFL